MPAPVLASVEVVNIYVIFLNIIRQRTHWDSMTWPKNIQNSEKSDTYSGTSPYGHLTSKKTSPLQSPWLSPKLYSTVQITPCNKVTSAYVRYFIQMVGSFLCGCDLFCKWKPCLSTHFSSDAFKITNLPLNVIPLKHSDTDIDLVC